MGQLVLNGEKFAGSNLDLKNNIVTFDSQDEEKPTEYTEFPVIESRKPFKNFCKTLSIMGKNIRYLAKLIGNTDISSIGNGTITNAIVQLNSDINSIGTIISGTVEIKTLSQTLQTVATITLPPGRYLIIGYSQINISDSAFCYVGIQGDGTTIVRFSGNGGGGAFTFKVENINVETTYNMQMYYGGSNTNCKNNYTSLKAIKL